MNILFLIGEWLLVIAFVSTLVVLAWLVIAALNLKNSAVRSAKRIYERPWQRIKNIMATGKGIGQQETIRVRHIAAHAKTAADSVQETVAETKLAAEGLRSSEMKVLLSNLQSAMQVFEIFNRVVRSAK